MDEQVCLHLVAHVARCSVNNKPNHLARVHRLEELKVLDEHVLVEQVLRPDLCDGGPCTA